MLWLVSIYIYKMSLVLPLGDILLRRIQTLRTDLLYTPDFNTHSSVTNNLITRLIIIRHLIQWNSYLWKVSPWRPHVRSSESVIIIKERLFYWDMLSWATTHKEWKQDISTTHPKNHYLAILTNKYIWIIGSQWTEFSKAIFDMRRRV